LFIKDEVIHINLEKVTSPKQILNNLKSFKIYLWNYFSSKKEFPSFNEISQIVQTRNEKNELEEIKRLQVLDEFKL
jgi:hypothetical protein